jgi:NADH-quinone oxidoreductase subunit M
MQEILAALSPDSWLLPAILTWPLVGAVLVALAGRAPAAVPAPDDVGPATGTAAQAVEARAGFLDARNLASAVLIGEALLTVVLWLWFEPGASAWQARVDVPWIPDWGARFTLGVDGLSLVMIVMTGLLMPLAVLGSWRNVGEKPVAYYALLLALTTGTMGVFLALDLLLFYVCWELVLIPMYFMIGVSGGEGRARASLQYFLVATLGSLLMLVAIVALWSSAGGTTFNVDQLAAASRDALTESRQIWLFLGFFVALAVKSAFFPVHSWLPGAQRAAPTSAAVALGIKVGTYGMLRFALPLFPAAVLNPTLRTTLVGLAVAGILYGALVATVQPDLRRIASYASVSHLGFVVLGIFALTVESLQGAMLVMVSHGVSLGALFLLAGMLEDRTGSSSVDAFGGLARALPLFSVLLVLASLSTIGLPGTNGFVGEFLVLLGAFRRFPGLTIIATVGVIFAAVYLLRALQRMLFETPRADGVLPAGVRPDGTRVRDLDARELAVLGAFAVAILWLGLAPAGVLRRMEGPVQRLVAQVQRGGSALAGAGLPPGALP